MKKIKRKVAIYARVSTEHEAQLSALDNQVQYYDDILKKNPDRIFYDRYRDEVLSYSEIVPAVIQNENHIYYQNTEIQEYVRQYEIIIENWYPFGGSGHTSENFNNEVIKELAEKYNKTSAQIILRWQLQAGYIAIPGSKNPDHIKENISIFDFELSDEDMKKIYNINENRRYENW